MSSIHHRRVFFSEKNGIRYYHDWALTSTGIGACAEPFIVNDRPTGGSVFTRRDGDEIRRIDAEEQITLAQRKRILSMDTEPHALHGGDQYPRA